jgi:copper chaperone
LAIILPELMFPLKTYQIMVHQIKVENIKCNGCAHTIKSGLSKLPGVESVEVDIANGIIHIEAQEEVTREFMIDKLHHMGYPEPGNGSGLTTATSFVSCMIGRVTS